MGRFYRTQQQHSPIIRIRIKKERKREIENAVRDSLDSVSVSEVNANAETVGRETHNNGSPVPGSESEKLCS